MHRFCLISERSDFLENFKILKNSQFSENSMISKKEYIAMFPQLALIEIRQKRLDLMKNRVSFNI